MDSTNFPPYHPIIQHYQPDKVPELLFIAKEVHYIHSHESFDEFLSVFDNLEMTKTISIYAKLKIENENLENLLENNKEKPNLYFELTKIFSNNQFFIHFISSWIDAFVKDSINNVQKHPLQQEKGIESFSSSQAEICRIEKDPNDFSGIIWSHSHPDPLKFKSYPELCHLKSLIKADIAYFDNIDHSIEWVKDFSYRSIESIKIFRFSKSVAKKTDEIFLDLIERLEPIVTQHYIYHRLQNNNQATLLFPEQGTQDLPTKSMNNPSLIYQLTQKQQKPDFPPGPVAVLKELERKKNIEEILTFMIDLLDNYMPKKYSYLLKEIKFFYNLNKLLIALQKVNILLPSLIHEKTPSYGTVFGTLLKFLHQSVIIQEACSKNNFQLYQFINPESNKRKKTSTPSAKMGKEKSVKKPSRGKKSKTNTESSSKNIPTEEVVQKNQMALQKDDLDFEGVVAKNPEIVQEINGLFNSFFHNNDLNSQ